MAKAHIVFGNVS